MSNAGRPTAYDPDRHNPWVWYLALEGLTDAEIAKKMGISKATLNNWKNEHPEFLDSIKRGKEGPDAKVVSSLYQRAIGYEVDEREVILDVDTGRPIRIKQIKKHIAPDVTAGIYWTKNRLGWRDSKKLEQERHDFETQRLEIEREKVEIMKQRVGITGEDVAAPTYYDDLGEPDDVQG